MSDPYRFPGMAHVPAPTDSPTLAPSPLAEDAGPCHADRKSGLEIAAVWLNGTNESNHGFLKAADQIARYLKTGTINNEG